MGPKCELCELDTQYYDEDDATCTDCPDSPILIGIASGIVACAVLMLFVAGRVVRMQRFKKARASVYNLVQPGVLKPVLKLAYTFLQICGSIPEVYGLQLPSQQSRIWSRLAVFDLSILEKTLLPCQGGFFSELLTTGFAPMCLIAVVVIGGAVLTLAEHARLKDPQPCDVSAKQAVLRGLPTALVLLYAFVPGVSVSPLLESNQFLTYYPLPTTHHSLVYYLLLGLLLTTCYLLPATCNLHSYHTNYSLAVCVL